MLLTGDIEAKGEKEITRLLNKDYDILKVAHHGSKNSTSKEFLDQVNAEYGIISCGENNRYGHPHRELLQRLEEEDMEILN
ncbi:ComEC/Rec2 family competence protein, partial [Gudongella sp. DL1XJH-153]|uniref:ComEC/Rec2 family competence protein n=1 Tax=Gudongella sp. DL1XJH-153 TaxID=3409804 RepID=UPI003BB606EC